MQRAIQVTSDAIAANDSVTLTYENRFRRRLKLETQNGQAILLDLDKAVELHEGECLILEDGSHVEIRAASENLAKLTATSAHHLARLAWHIGNRHLSCEIHSDHLLIQRDHVIEDMIIKLGGKVEHVEAPFNPEGGAYGHGRTHSHAH